MDLALRVHSHCATRVGKTWFMNTRPVLSLGVGARILGCFGPKIIWSALRHGNLLRPSNHWLARVTGLAKCP